MPIFRGIPRPQRTLESLFETVLALIEAVETDAQGLRNRQIRRTDSERARSGLIARQQSRANNASLAVLRDLVDELDVRLSQAESDIGAAQTDIITNRTDIDSNDLELADHETRITTLEGFHP